MTVEIDYNYGADADGNRGMKQYFYEIDDSDRDDIVEQLLENPYSSTVYLVCPYTDELIEFDVDREDYIKE